VVKLVSQSTSYGQPIFAGKTGDLPPDEFGKDGLETALSKDVLCTVSDGQKLLSARHGTGGIQIASLLTDPPR
jgi:hypothetical protein